MLAQNFKTHTDLGLDEALYNEIKPEQAAIALRNYLTTGEISWAHLK